MWERPGSRMEVCGSRAGPVTKHAWSVTIPCVFPDPSKGRSSLVPVYGTKDERTVAEVGTRPGIRAWGARRRHIVALP